MAGPDWKTLPPRGISDEEMKAQLHTWAAEARAKRGYELSDEERRRRIDALAAEARAERGYDLSEEEQQWQLYWLVVEARAKRGLRAIALAHGASEYRFEPRGGALIVREGRPHETRLDRIERALSRTRVQLEALAGRVDMVWEHVQRVDDKVDGLSQRFETLERKVDALDLRVLRLEQHARLSDGGSRSS